MSLQPVAARLADLLGKPVAFAMDCVGPTAQKAVQVRPASGVVLLETSASTRRREERRRLRRQLAALADVYVNDAFGTAHRAHASVEALVHRCPDAAPACWWIKEIRFLIGALSDPGAAVRGRAGRGKGLRQNRGDRQPGAAVDRLLIGGAMAYTFFKAMGKPSASPWSRTTSWTPLERSCRRRPRATAAAASDRPRRRAKA